MKIDKNIKNLIKQELQNDIGSKDITTHALISRDMRTNAVIIAKQSGVVAGMDIARAVFEALDANIEFKPFVKDGDKVKYAKKIAWINGSARAILSAERTALNFLSHLSGIATLTQKFVRKVKPYKAKILDTRKTMPGLRNLEKYAVRRGGGINHRIGLWDGILIKDNHIAAISCLSPYKDKLSAVSKRKKPLEKMIKDARKKASKDMLIEIEVKNLEELKDALNGLPDIILLDNMSMEQIKKSVNIRNKFLTKHKAVLLEVSGGVNLGNARRIAKAGVDRISIGALTHSANAFNLSLEIVLK